MKSLTSNNKKENPQNFFQIIFSSLPILAEEGNLQHAASVDEIDAKLIEKLGCSRDEATSRRLISQRLLQAICVLDDHALERGEWRFVSFPASLLARSLISGLAEPEQIFFPKNYWEQGAHRPADVVEEQRLLLYELESRRLQFHPQPEQARPIRVVHVAWGLIRLDGRFLLLHREDRNRRGRGNYVMPGGRFNAVDWPQIDETRLQDIQQLGQRLPLEVMENTLLREISEELGLKHKDHYQIRHWSDLSPWRQLEGARNHLAYSEYLMSLWHLELNEAGETCLLARLASQDHVWFSKEEMQSQRLPDGTTSFLDALHGQFGQEFPNRLQDTPESRPDIRAGGESDFTDFSPIGPALRRGKTGKEKTIDLALDDWERRFLFALAWHARGLPLKLAEGVETYLRGWVKLTADQLAPARLLARKLMLSSHALMEISEGLVRLALAPDCVYFAPEIYRFALFPEGNDDQAQRWRFELLADPVSTPLGDTAARVQPWAVSRNAARIVQCVAMGTDPESDSRIKAGDIQKTLRDQFDQPLRRLGLRKLVRVVEGRYFLDVTPIAISGSSPLAARPGQR